MSLLSSRFTTASANAEEVRSSNYRLLFLVPAHNEELLIGDCLQSLRNMDYPDDRYQATVIADNCTDSTHGRAVAAGAECLVRNEPELTGKPHALNWALDRIEVDKWDSVIILDADSTVNRNFAKAISSKGPLRDLVLQAYFSTSNETENWLTNLGGLLARIKYEVFYPLKDCADLNSPLTGNGMCIGSTVLQRYGWFAFGLTENWEMYAKYTFEGIPIHYVREAKLFSQEARSLTQSAPQRRRWSLGRVSTLKTWASTLATCRELGWRQRLNAIAELADPGPALHSSLVLLMVPVAVAVLPYELALAFAWLALFSVSHYVIGLTVVLVEHPRPLTSIAALSVLPFYMAWRFAVGIWTLVTASDTNWERTERHHSGDRH